MSNRNTEIIAFVSLGIALVSVLWNIFFGYAKLVSKIDLVQARVDQIEGRMENGFEKMESRFEKLENKVESLRLDVHKIDTRVTAIEQELKMR